MTFSKKKYQTLWKKNKPLTKWVLLFMVSLSILVVVFIYHDQLAHLRSLGLAGIFLANIVGSATLFIPAPAIATVIAGGIIYPPFFVALVATIGAAVGDMFGYFIGFSGRKVLVEGKETKSKLVIFVERFGGFAIFIFAFVPNPFFDAVGLIAGAIGYSPYKFFIWLFLGRFLRNLMLAFFGAHFH